MKKSHRRHRKTTENTEKICVICGLFYPPIDTDLHRLKEKTTENTEKICANLCNLWFLSLASLSTDYTDFHRLKKKTTENTEIYREHRNLQRTQKFFFAFFASSASPRSSAPLFPLRLCVNLGVLCILGDLGVIIHRLTQIFTDFRGIRKS